MRVERVNQRKQGRAQRYPVKTRPGFTNNTRDNKGELHVLQVLGQPGEQRPHRLHVRLARRVDAPMHGSPRLLRVWSGWDAQGAMRMG